MAVATVRLLRAAVPPEPWNNPGPWPEWRRLLPHVLTATDASRALDHADDDAAWLLNAAAGYLLVRGEPAASLPLFEGALELRRGVLGEEHPDTLTSASNLALNLGALRQYEAARRLGEDTLARLRRVLGEDHSNTLDSANTVTSPSICGSWRSMRRRGALMRTPWPGGVGRWVRSTPTPSPRPATSLPICGR